MPKPCPFCAIAEGAADASIVLRSPEVVAFLDVKPLFKGHVLVVPTEHIETLSELPKPLIEPLFSTVKKISQAVERALSAQGSFVAMNNVVSQSVPHLHVHVVPRTKGDGLRGFFWPRHHYDSVEERDEYARRIAAAVESPS